MKYFEFETSINDLYSKEYWLTLDNKLSIAYAQFVEATKNEYASMWFKLNGKTKQAYFDNNYYYYAFWLNNLTPNEFDQHKSSIFNKTTKLKINKTLAYNLLLSSNSETTEYNQSTLPSLYDYFEKLIAEINTSIDLTNKTGLLKIGDKYYLISEEQNLALLIQNNQTVMDTMGFSDYMIIHITQHSSKKSYYIITYNQKN
jgi:hypothetical protein